MKKRAVSSLLAILAVVSFILPALATEPVGDGESPVPETETESAIWLDGVSQPVEYEMRDGTTYVTVSSFVSMVDPQAVVEEEDGVVTVSSAVVEEIVDDEGNTANVVQETLGMTVSVGVPYIVANGRYLYAKDKIVVLNDHAAAPIRTLAKVFNLGVSYDAQAQAVLLTRSEDGRAYLEPGDSYYDADAMFWLSRIIHQESGNQTLEGKIAVGNVVMNRVNSPMFPDNIYDVLTQKNQFSPASTISKWTPNSGSELAAKLVLDGAQVVPTALFFNTKGLSSYASKYRTYVTTIGSHDFFA